MQVKQTKNEKPCLIPYNFCLAVRCRLSGYTKHACMYTKWSFTVKKQSVESWLLVALSNKIVQFMRDFITQLRGWAPYKAQKYSIIIIN